MSQLPPQTCKQCQAPLAPGQRFCQNCGTLAEPSGPAQTVASSQSQPGPTVTAPPPGPGPTMAAPPPTMAAPSHTDYSGGDPLSFGGDSTPPQYSTGSDPYSTPPPAPPTDPYSIPSYPASTPNTSYGGPSYPTPPQPKKSTNVGLMVGIGILVVLLLCGGISWFGIQGISNLVKGTSYTDTRTLSNLTVTYADDQITFTSVQQQPKFDDDYDSKPNHIRINFSEKQVGTDDSLFSYSSAFHLILPDKTVASVGDTSEISAPDQGVNRTNWIDFGTNDKVDLSNLILRVGESDEAKMEIPLKSGADVSQFQPKTINPNQAFKYVTMDWTLVSATRSLSY
ncbi:MAG: zinc ribbon domain-containing protein, partial [Ktedonobacteraceae bacterium]|nr:zinc ribbon domain-containing protein [Ktedonobacteraceae bacterium]